MPVEPGKESLYAPAGSIRLEELRLCVCVSREPRHGTSCRVVLQVVSEKLASLVEPEGMLRIATQVPNREVLQA